VPVFLVLLVVQTKYNPFLTRFLLVTVALTAPLFARFFRGMLERGVYLPPSAFESAFLSDAHGDEEIDATLEAADEVLGGIS